MPDDTCSDDTSTNTCDTGYWLLGVFCSTLEYKAAAGSYSDCDLNNAIVMTDYGVGPNNPSGDLGTSYNKCTTVQAINGIAENFFGKGLPATLNCVGDGSGTGGWSENWPLGGGSGTVTGPAPETGTSVPFNPSASVQCPPSQADVAAGALPHSCAFVVVPVTFTYACLFVFGVGGCVPDVADSNYGVSLLGSDFLATTFSYAYTTPKVTALSPPSGNINGGTVVTITGNGLTNASAVDFGTLPAKFTRISDTEIQAIAPRAALPGPVDVVVSSVADGDSTTSAADRYLYYPPPGYWLATSDGDIFAAGQAPALGRSFATSADPVVGVAPTADGRGYWTVTANGTVENFGDAQPHGTLPDLGVNVNNIVAIAPTGDGGGYWLIGKDGGEFAFGDAHYHGSLPGVGVHVSDVVGMVATSDGGGYWIVGSDGGVFAFGNASYVGSLPGIHVKANNIRAMIPSPTRQGYILVGSDGGTFVFGTGVQFHGSLPGEGIHVNDIVGLALTYGSGGYWLAGSNGTAYNFGNAASYPRPAGITDHLPVVAIAGT
jgi:hypothetical protein